MSRSFVSARLGVAALISATLAVSGGASPVSAHSSGSHDVAPRPVTSAIDNDQFDSQFTTLGHRVVFAGFDSRGSEPWITDGTPTGTHRIKVITNHTHSHLSNLVAAGSRVYFTVIDEGVPDFPWQLWVTNGKASGTHLVHSFPQMGTRLVPNHLTAVGKNLFFNASSATGRQLWVTNGTKSGTTLLKSFPDDGLTFEDADWAMAGLDGRLYFPAEDGPNGGAHGIELWSSDGTKAGTKMAVDVTSGPTGSAPFFLRTFKNHVYFFAAGVIYASDGSPGGTRALTAGGQTPNGSLLEAQPLAGKLFMPANVGGTNGWMVTNGMAGGTTFEPWPAGLQITSAYAGVGNAVLFGARTIGPNDDEELWSTDGTTAGTHRVKDIYPGLLPSSPSNLTSIGTRAVFDALIPGKGDRLFVSDGTASGTHRLDYQQVTNSSTFDLSFRAGMVFFDAPDGIYSRPWVWEPGPRYLSWCSLKVAHRFVHGKRPKATAKVGSSKTLTGAGVRLYDGKKKLGTHRLVKGRAVFTLPAGLKVGHHRLRVDFPVHGDVRACTVTTKVTVTR